MMIPMKKHLFFATLACVFATTSCLKTRTQVKPDDDSDNSDSRGGSREGVPAKVKEVRPQDSYAIDEIKNEITRLNGRIEDLDIALGVAVDGADGRRPLRKALRLACCRATQPCRHNQRNDGESRP